MTESCLPAVMSLAFTIALWVSGTTTVQADNAACWGLGKDDPSRPDISCTSLTEVFILSMRGATRAEVLKTMNAKGRGTPNGPLHFISNAGMGKGWDGAINFIFDDSDRVTIIAALVDGPNLSPSNMELIWNAKEGFFCSDFPGSGKRCN